MQLTFAFVTVLAVLPGVQQAEPFQIRERVEKLVRDMDSDRFAVRRDARRALLEIGPGALPFLNIPKGASVGLRNEIDEVRSLLRNLQAVRSLDAATVTLVGPLTVDQIADRINKQTGNKLSVARLRPSVRGLAFEMYSRDQPFWREILSLAEKLEAGIDVTDGEVRLVDEPDKRAVSIEDANLIRLAPIERKELVGQPGKTLLRLPISFASEPRLRGLFLQAKGADTSVFGTGSNIRSFSPDRTLELPISGRGEEVSWRHDVVVENDDMPEKLGVRGEIDVLMAAGYERFEFENLAIAKRQRQDRAGVVLLVNEVEIDDERGNLSVTITVNWKRSVAAFDSYRTWQFHNEAWLRTADGKRIDFKGPLRTDAQAGGGVRLTYTFNGVAETLRGCTFMYEAPTALRTRRVRFRFENIPIPKS